MRVLVIFPGALGDLVCLGPAIRAIGRSHLAVELMARAELARFACGRMGVSAGHSIDRREVSMLFRGSEVPDDRARSFFGQFERIYSFFASDDPEFRHSLKFACGAEISFHPFRPPGTGHVARLYLESIGCGGEPLESRIDPTGHDLDAAARVLRELGMVPRKFVIVFPGSGSAAKNWPQDRFLNLSAKISSSLRPLVVLGPAEIEIAETFLKHGVATITNLELGTVAALAHLAAGFIGNDSGVSHLAAASGAPGVVIFGPTDPDRWAPLGDVAVVRRRPLAALGVDETLNILHSRLVS